MSRLVGRRGAGQYKWRWFVVAGYRRLPPRMRWLSLASLLIAIAVIGFAVGLAIYSIEGTSGATLPGAIFTTTPRASSMSIWTVGRGPMPPNRLPASPTATTTSR